MAIYYPSCIFNFTLRFDETLFVVKEPTPVSTDDRAQRPFGQIATPEANGLITLPTPDLGDAFGTYGSLDPDAVFPEPLILQRGNSNETFVQNRIPKEASIELPGYRQAATFDATFDFRDFPIDPRTVRAAAVEVHLGSVDPGDFGRGVTLTPEPGLGRTSVLRTRNAAGGPNPDTLVMVGVVDEWEVDNSENGSLIKMSGRDLRGLLLDTLISNDPRITTGMIDSLDTSLPIDNVIRQVLQHHPMGDRFSALVNPDEWPDGVVPAPLLGTSVPRHRRGARGNRRGGRAGAGGDVGSLSYWDLIVRLCFLVGAIPYFQGRDLLIRPARSIFDQQRAGFNPNVPTPFVPDQPRNVEGMAPFSIRRLIYGRDVQKLSFKRTLAGASKPKTVRVVNVDQSNTARGSGQLLEARWPPPQNDTVTRRARGNRAAPGGQQEQEEIVPIKVHGIRDQSQMVEIARSVYEEIGRNEIGGTAETRNLASLGGDNRDPDLLRLRPGDAVEFFVDTRSLSSRAPLVSSFTDHFRNSFEEQVRLIQQRIGNENLSRVIVATSRGQIQGIQTFFRVSTVKFGWGESGVDISFDFQNYFIARYGVTPTVGRGSGSVTRTTVPRSTF